MTTSQNPNNQNTQANQKNFLHRFIESFRRNSTVFVVATIASIMISIIGFVVDFVEFQAIIHPPIDISNYKSGSVLVKITGWSETSYNFAEQDGTDGLRAFFVQRLKGKSEQTSMIYTDHQPTDRMLNKGVSPEKDISVLKNVDYEGTIPDITKPISKRNSQTLLARLIQASRNEEPVCLFVYGIRDNEKSQFLNIIDFKTVNQNFQDEYNTLIKEENLHRKQDKLVKLTGDACSGLGKPLFG
ncbi:MULTISPECIES: hypothetical protein [Okeania]|uniref:Uncharacterized protein n=1 Tax=Okeania hirsuta TaxID=1458930 RepID=A0A3N6RTV4_9CYAN|nr:MULTISPECIES: hypothetical protein [Okeania]NES79396.1 hypothetical protein [Okeania sp. SIO1H4]NES90234.1 hypothetical protein [Okeania sp. SIO2B9]NET23054.1 hypothetical protein [Okeania sp. SIO1H5]NET78116.1 hypothetical protein [Okeania sp. SIO1F9]NET97181.1 hypothetical protein [Okeania sp. SIO1H2]